MTGATFHKPLTRIKWRAGQTGMSRSQAVANAEAKLVEIKEAVLAVCDRDLSLLAALAFDDARGFDDPAPAYEAAQNISAIIGTFGYEALGKVAFGLCEHLSADAKPSPLFDLVAKAHVAAMVLLRQMPITPGMVGAVDGLSSLRAAAAEDASPEAFPVARLVYASLTGGEKASFAQDARSLAGAILVEAQDLGVTGLLLAHGGWFLHWLEGDANAVAKLYATILVDSRQAQIKALSLRGAPKRRFPGWRMASSEAGGAEAMLLAQTREGFIPHSLKPKEACGLLEAFASLGDTAAARKVSAE